MDFIHDNPDIKSEECKLVTDRILNDCIGKKYITLLEKTLLYDEEYFSSHESFSGNIITNIFILYIREWEFPSSESHSVVDFEHTLLIQSKFECKYIIIRNCVCRKKSSVRKLNDVNILSNSENILEFIVKKKQNYSDGSEHYAEYYHKYVKINKNMAIHFNKVQSFNGLDIRIIHNLLVKYRYISTWAYPGFNVKNSNINIGNGISVYEYVKCTLEEHNSGVGNPYERCNIVYNGNGVKKSIITKYIIDNYNKECGIEYTYYMKCMYYAFLPFVKLVKLGKYILLNEAEIINETIDILKEVLPESFDTEPLPILLLRAVLLEHTFLLFRKSTQ